MASAEEEDSQLSPSSGAHAEADAGSVASKPYPPEASHTPAAEGGDEPPQIPIAQLPPLPTPHTDQQRPEEFLGCAGVLGGSACVIGVTIGAAVVQAGHLPVWVNVIFVATILLNVLLAWFGLWGMLFTDPGHVERSEETCYPIPAEVLEALSTKGDTEGMVNIRTFDPASGQESASYCVRCCLWRPPGSHHCRTCNRCVVKFDHHVSALHIPFT